MRTLPIGPALVRAGVISLEQAADAALAQRVEGGLIGQHLIRAGAVSRRDMYAALAVQWKAPSIDLVADPPDPWLVTGEPHRIVTRGWVPCSVKDDVAVVATSVPPTGERLLAMRQATGASRIVLRTATDWDVFQVAAAARRTQLLQDPPGRAYGTAAARRPGRRSVVAATAVAVAVACVVVVGTGLAVAPERTGAVLVVAADVLVVGVVLLRLVLWRVSRAVTTRSPSPGTPRVDDPPFYSVLVPGAGPQEDLRRLLDDLDGLDHPRSRLEVLVMIGEDDHAGVASLKQIAPPPHVRLLPVPAQASSSDALLCTYGLSLARGELVVRFRPGDSPRKDQLTTAVAAFASPRRPVCVLATLVHRPSPRHLVGRFSAVVRADWFLTVAPALAAWGVPVRLGGASEHVEAAELRAAGAWDPDDAGAGAGLGRRLRSTGRPVTVMSSTTATPAPATLREWADQLEREAGGWPTILPLAVLCLGVVVAALTAAAVLTGHAWA